MAVLKSATSNEPKLSSEPKRSSEPAPSSESKPEQQCLGAILVDNGRLPLKDVESILLLMKEQGLRFGEAALRLKLVSQTDVDFALAAQFEYPFLEKGQGDFDSSLVAAYMPNTPQVEALRALRCQLMLRWFTVERRRLAVVSPAKKDGRSYLAANLAIVFSQLGERTLLIDADMRAPRQHSLFKLDNQYGLSSLLAGRTNVSKAVQRVPHFNNLSVLPAGPIPPNPQELLGRREFTPLLEELERSYDVILVDTPAAAHSADAESIANQTRGALLLARRHRTRLPDAQALSQGLAATGVTMVGCVLNTIGGRKAAKKRR